MDTSLSIITRLDQPATSVGIRAWKVGQILKATVIQGTPTASRRGTAVLQIGSRRFSVRSQTPLQEGEILHVKIKQTTPNLILQRLHNTDTSLSPKSQAATRLNRILQSLLATQLSPQAALTRLAQASTQTVTPGNRFSHLLQDLLQTIPEFRDLLSVARLRTGVENSGHLMEARLLNNQPHPILDFKAQLLGLLAEANTQNLTNLAKTIEGLVNRLTLNQLQSAQTTTNPNWLVELPVRTAQGFDLIRLEIEAHPRQPDHPDEPDTWSVKLQLDLQGLGPMEAHIQSLGGRVSARFWVENASSRLTLEQGLSELASAWRTKGLNPGALQVYPGSPPLDTVNPETTTKSGNLFDTHV